MATKQTRYGLVDTGVLERLEAEFDDTKFSQRVLDVQNLVASDDEFCRDLQDLATMVDEVVYRAVYGRIEGEYDNIGALADDLSLDISSHIEVLEGLRDDLEALAQLYVDPEEAEGDEEDDDAF